MNPVPDLTLEERIVQVDAKLDQLLQMHSYAESGGAEHFLKRENDYLHQALEMSDRQKVLLQQELTHYQHSVQSLEQQRQELQTELTQVRQILIQQETQIEILRQALTQSQDYAQEIEAQLAQVQKRKEETEASAKPRLEGIFPEILAEKLGISTAEVFQQWRAGELQGWHLGRDQRFYPAR
ncbi:hypothetical protein PN466_08435 [Roseofilum reptotaenium CS-1145]|uniref:Uncharacterized protein n=1 Tax=Roseofilum reptotaenium AO1-A TaxID=1925591 RepID=A0A1L9QNU8_9CYAN|nr:MULTISPECIES: hypothetical protein [Roseofilum]MBP0029620.1 hypothetical protein [Roseofilum sp. Guam]MDB9516973.1 hypothetical protein [Roseofilum reptotaenium CS-1145]OJJ24363.1 hypothetical protein BI308_16885 [Roseofilum reptotaenium AO1-A]